MTLTQARREYRQFVSRMDVAFAFGRGCSVDANHLTLRGLRDKADRLLAQLRTLEAATGKHALGTPGRVVKIECSRHRERRPPRDTGVTAIGCRVLFS